MENYPLKIIPRRDGILHKLMTHMRKKSFCFIKLIFTKVKFSVQINVSIFYGLLGTTTAVA
jgi:hypothetical protein